MPSCRQIPTIQFSVFFSSYSWHRQSRILPKCQNGHRKQRRNEKADNRFFPICAKRAQRDSLGICCRLKFRRKTSPWRIKIDLPIDRTGKKAIRQYEHISFRPSRDTPPVSPHLTMSSPKSESQFTFESSSDCPSRHHPPGRSRNKDPQ